MNKHPKDMDADELRELVFDMAGLALDLAQHLNFTNEMLREDLQTDAYKRAEQMAYQLTWHPYTERGPRNDKLDIVVFGANGLERP